MGKLLAGALGAAVAIAAAYPFLPVPAGATGSQISRWVLPAPPYEATRVQAKPGQTLTDFPIGFVELDEDPLYSTDYAYFMIASRPLGRPYIGALVGQSDNAAVGGVLGVDFHVEKATGGNVDELATAVSGWLDQGMHFVIADLPAAELLDLVDRFRDREVVFFNVQATDDSLRGADCRANVAHIIPSLSMYSDALVQYLVSRKWTNILTIQGPLPQDAVIAGAMATSARKFGARVVDTVPFVLTNDPRFREQSNVALMTAGRNFDAAFVADWDGEFARHVPYETSSPRPVVGAAGLSPFAWWWSWDGQGAPQLQTRFEQASYRRMGSEDWAAYVAVKGVVQSVLRSRSTEFAAVRDYLFSDAMNLDGTKGNPMSFRSWDHQLRQPLILATTNAWTARAPIEGFLHQTNELDTLGVDERQTTCRF